jgi:DNA-binding response OmpR family regulator
MEKVLIIDDDKNIREIAKISLEDDFIVFVASSCDEGMKVATTEKPDIILLDRMMPGIDGLGTLARLREVEATRSIPVVFLTAKVQSQEMSEYEGLDISGVLGKPFDPMSFPDEIRKILGRV